MSILTSNSKAPKRPIQTEHYQRVGNHMYRQVERRDGRVHSTRVAVAADAVGDAAEQFDFSWLASNDRPTCGETSRAVRVVDLFSGCGGLTLGVAEAARALGLQLEPVLAADIDAEALSVYESNFPTSALIDEPLESVLQPYGSGGASVAERRLLDLTPSVEMLIGGPPCQGNSSLNNYTRSADPKNQLYALMARFCELARPTHVIIENVPGVARDRSHVAQRTWSYLTELGYNVDSGVMHAQRVGVAQNRKRSFTLASLEVAPSVEGAVSAVSTAPRPLRWAIGDLSVDPSRGPFGTAPTPNEENARRIAYLFEQQLYDLPDVERPDCHRLKKHSYVSMYGRLRWTEPAPTITTGFGSMGRGRWVHPDERRTITPHEAARIQGFPDFFGFGDVNRTMLHKLIGNAVPPKLGYAAGMELLR